LRQPALSQEKLMRITFELESDYIELIKLLKATGICTTGGMAKIIVNEGHVKVDGVVETRKRCKIRKGQAVGVANTTILVV
jgi:ribosome-associated protein